MASIYRGWQTSIVPGQGPNLPPLSPEVVVQGRFLSEIAEANQVDIRLGMLPRGLASR